MADGIGGIAPLPNPRAVNIAQDGANSRIDGNWKFNKEDGKGKDDCG